MTFNEIITTTYSTILAFNTNKKGVLGKLTADIDLVNAVIFVGVVHKVDVVL